MPHVIDVPPSRGDLSDIAAKAAVSVPEALSARRPSVRLMALVLVPACIAAPFLGGAAAPAVAAVIALAVVLRLMALAHVLGRHQPPRHAVPARLPRVSILLPLRGEAKVVAALAEALGRLDYPAELIEVIALLEEDDFATRTAIRARAPRGWQVIAIPRGHPRNKPRACNVGLAFATGEVIAIFDAEDRPEPDQVRKAVAALAADPGVAVAQARLGCDHAGAGDFVLGRLWGLEYAVLFGAVQPALARAGLPFLLGGTSNWFRGLM